MPKKNAKNKRGDAERAAEWLACKVYGCVSTVRAVRTQWQRQDLFGADIMGKRKDGSCVFIQATAGQHSAVTARRRKLEPIPWQDNDTVLIAQLVQTEDPANARRKLWFFRIHLYEQDLVTRMWTTDDRAIPVPKLWFKSYKNNSEL